MNAIEIKNLTKKFPGFKIDNLSLMLPSGCIMGLIGENGAGKTTVMKLILDIIHKDGGSIRILGKDNEDNINLTKEDIGVVMDNIGIPECLSAEQVGKVMKCTFRRWDSDEYLRLLNILEIPFGKQFKDFSRGMKMKLGIAIAMSHGSKLLLMDEPTSGLDPVVRDTVVDMLMDFTRAEDHSVLISSHIVSDLEKLCDYVAFLHKGKLLLCEEKDKLLSEYGIIRCSNEQLHQIEEESVIYKKEIKYGVEAIVKRDRVKGINISPISIEELFIFMVKEAK